MGLLTQMTPYGVYDIRYFPKKKAVGTKGQAQQVQSSPKSYADTAAFYWKDSFWDRGAAIQKNAYKEKVFHAMEMSRSLSEAADSFVNAAWPKKNVETNGLVTGQANPEAEEKDYWLEVFSLAQDHSFATQPLWRNTQQIASDGAYSLVVEKDAKQEKALFYLNETDNAWQVTNKIADAINAFSTIAKAKVSATEGMVSMSVVASVNGGQGRFAIYDDVGGVLEKLGLAALAQGQDGRVAVDGKEYLLSDRKLLLDHGNLELQLIRPGQTRVSVAADDRPTVLSLDTLLGRYNDFHTFFAKTDNKTPKSEAMFETFGNLLQGTLSGDLEKLGISRSFDGDLALNKEKLTENLQTDPSLVKRLSDGHAGLAFILSNMANSVQKNPLSTYFTAAPSLDGPERFHGLMLDLQA